MEKNIYIIVAITKKEHAIGKDNDMLFFLKKDLEYFKETTLNHTIVCGRKTYFSFPVRPLPGRKNIILTKSDSNFEGAETMHSVEEVVEYARKNSDEKIFICGGEQIYKQFIKIASKLYITFIYNENPVDADSFFPLIDEKIWNMTKSSDFIYTENTPKFKFTVFDRK